MSEEGISRAWVRLRGVSEEVHQPCTHLSFEHMHGNRVFLVLSSRGRAVATFNMDHVMSWRTAKS